MITIYEHGPPNGIGHTLESFCTQFDSICRNHLHTKRARAFAFIFFNLADTEFRKVLQDQGVFTKLDRLAGRDLSIFFLHVGKKKAIKRFNEEFISRLGLPENVARPLIVFFKFTGDKIEDVYAVHLEDTTLIHAYHGIHSVIEDYISKSLDGKPKGSAAVRWIKSGAKFISVEIFRAVLKRGLDGAG